MTDGFVHFVTLAREQYDRTNAVPPPPIVIVRLEALLMNTRESGQPFKRLFVAVECEAPQRQDIARFRHALNLRGGKPVPPGQFHLTLLFLGDVDSRQVPAVCAAIESVSRPAAMRLVLDRLTVWQRPGVLVLESPDAPPALRRLAYDLQQAVLPWVPQPPAQEYRPHLTLMREFRGQVPEAAIAPAFWLKVRQFTLYESYKGRYLPLADWALA